MTGRCSHLEKRQPPRTIEGLNVFLLSYKFTTSSCEMLGWFSNMLKSFIHFFLNCWLEKHSSLYLEEWDAGTTQLSPMVFRQPCFLHTGWWFLYPWEVLGFHNMAFEFRVPVTYVFKQSSTTAYPTFGKLFSCPFIHKVWGLSSLWLSLKSS